MPELLCCSLESQTRSGERGIADFRNTCYDSPNLSAPECDRIARSPSGQVSRFDLLNVENLDTIETSGVDMNSTFSWDTRFGLVSADWLVTYLDEWKQTTATGTEDDRDGSGRLHAGDYAARARSARRLSRMEIRYVRPSLSRGAARTLLQRASSCCRPTRN